MVVSGSIKEATEAKRDQSEDWWPKTQNKCQQPA
jgi:hypothetical protein